MAQVTQFDDKIISFMRQHGAEKIGVFGSYARNEARTDSDLDLMVRFKDQNASFQHRISDSNTVEARPPLAIGSSTRTISCHRVAPSRRAASRMSLGMSLK